MKLYRCFIKGENFAIGGSDGPYGFYTTRFVRAESAERAETLAVEILRSDPKLDAPPSTRSEKTMVYFESIEEIDAIPQGVNEPGTGFAFFKMGT